MKRQALEIQTRIEAKRRVHPLQHSFGKPLFVSKPSDCRAQLGEIAKIGAHIQSAGKSFKKPLVYTEGAPLEDWDFLEAMPDVSANRLTSLKQEQEKLERSRQDQAKKFAARRQQIQQKSRALRAEGESTR